MSKKSPHCVKLHCSIMYEDWWVHLAEIEILTVGFYTGEMALPFIIHNKAQSIQLHTKIRAEKKCYLFKKCQIVYVFASFWRLFVELSQMITMFVIVWMPKKTRYRFWQYFSMKVLNFGFFFTGLIQFLDIYVWLTLEILFFGMIFHRNLIALPWI